MAATRSRINWRDCAARLAAALPRERLHPAVLAWADRSPRDESWGVAFSGGADSLVLLLLLWSHWPDRRKRLVALHFNHRLRGAAANADERFCRQVCVALGLRHASERWKRPPREASEAEARAARHAFFDRQLRRRRARALWLGHQQDDIAETMLMRLARGSGLGGLAAPRPVQMVSGQRLNLRPLLGLAKSDMVAALTTAGARWCEDASNATGAFLRNRMRHEVIPVWRTVTAGRDTLAGIALSRERIDEDDAALDAWLAVIDPVAKDGTLNLQRLANKPRGMVRRALHLWLGARKQGKPISRQAFDALLSDIVQQRLTRHSLDRFHFVQIGKRFAKVTRVPGKISQ